jgi:AbrB family looped-hinge helix DNA binding protein
MGTSDELTFKKVRVTDKGQISIPVEVQRSMGIGKGDELILVAKGGKIVLEKPARVAEILDDEFSDVQGYTEMSLSRLWLNKKDDVWDRYLQKGSK